MSDQLNREKLIELAKEARLIDVVNQPFFYAKSEFLLDALEQFLLLAAQTPVSGAVDEPTPDETLIACLQDDAAKLKQANPDDEMAVTMLEAAARIAALSSPAALAQQELDAIPAELLKIGELLRTQDNRITDQPIFIVQQKRSYVTESGYNNYREEWRETESGEHMQATPERAKRLEAVYQRTGVEPKGWKRYAVFDVWEFVTACFTEQGCKDYIAINGHNLKSPRIYAEGSYRNHEYQAIRKWLESLPAIQQTTIDSADTVQGGKS